MATKLLYNRGERKIDHKGGTIFPKTTVRLTEEDADYLKGLLPDDLIDPADANKIFDQVVGGEDDAKGGEDLSALTVVQLRQLAEDKGVVIPQGTNKADIISLLSA